MKVCKDKLLNKGLIIYIHAPNSSYAGHSLGYEIQRSKERPTNSLMKTILTHISPPLMKLKLPFKKGRTESLKFDLTLAVTTVI